MAKTVSGETRNAWLGGPARYVEGMVPPIHLLFTIYHLPFFSVCDEGAVGFGAAVAEKLPGVTDLANHVEVDIGNNDGVLVAGRLCDDLPTWVTEITLTIEFADVPRLFMADAIDRSDKVSIGGGVSRLLQFPKVLRESCDSRRRIKNKLGAV